MPGICGLAMLVEIRVGALCTNLAHIPFLPTTWAVQIKEAWTLYYVSAHSTVCAEVVAVLVGLEVGCLELASAPTHADLGAALLV